MFSDNGCGKKLEKYDLPDIVAPQIKKFRGSGCGCTGLSSGDIDVHDFIDGDTLEKVEAYLAGHSDEKALKPIYEYFDSKISYGALRMAIAAIRKE